MRFSDKKMRLAAKNLRLGAKKMRFAAKSDFRKRRRYAVFDAKIFPNTLIL